jgi:hypothetical protein
MSDEKQIQLEDGTKLDWLDKSAETFLSKLIILYGMANTGKTKMIIDIMYRLKDSITFPFIICESQLSAEDYAPIISHDHIKNAKTLTKEWLEQFIKIQKGIPALYNTANNIKNLQSLFGRIKSEKANALEAKIINKTEDIIQEIELSNMSLSQKKITEMKIHEQKSNMLKLLYRKFIRQYYHELDKYSDNLTEDEYITLHHIDFKPHALLIFDDCACWLRKWIKESKLIRELVYNHRAYYTTIILTTTSRREIEPVIRGIADLSFYMSVHDALDAFDQQTNEYSSEKRKQAINYINVVFKNNNSDEKNHKKLVYNLSGCYCPSFHYTVADLFENNFQFSRINTTLESN